MKKFDYEKATKDGFYLKDKSGVWYVGPEYVEQLFNIIDEILDDILINKKTKI